MSHQFLPRPERHAIGAFVRRFEQLYLAIRLAGNAGFVTGSVLFMSGRQDVGLWFFLAGSVGMLLGTLGELLHKGGRHRLARFDVHPGNPDQRWSQAPPADTQRW